MAGAWFWGGKEKFWLVWATSKAEDLGASLGVERAGVCGAGWAGSVWGVDVLGGGGVSAAADFTISAGGEAGWDAGVEGWVTAGAGGVLAGAVLAGVAGLSVFFVGKSVPKVFAMAE